MQMIALFPLLFAFGCPASEDPVDAGMAETDGGSTASADSGS